MSFTLVNAKRCLFHVVCGTIQLFTVAIVFYLWLYLHIPMVNQEKYSVTTDYGGSTRMGVVSWYYWGALVSRPQITKTLKSSLHNLELLINY